MIAANAQIERPAALSSLVDRVRCISTWSLGKVSTTSNTTRKMKPQTVALVRSKLKSSRRVFSWSDAAASSSGRSAPDCQKMKPTANRAPPNITSTCTTSVQITALEPPIVE